MRLSPWVAATLALLAGAAQGEEGDFPLKSKAIASASAPKAAAPFTASREPAVRDPIPFHIEHAIEEDGRVPQSACERSAHDLCYDLAGGRIVYRPARRYMPRIGDLTPENVSLRRNRVIFKYSF